jgi:hypothetical protein
MHGAEKLSALATRAAIHRIEEQAALLASAELGGRSEEGHREKVVREEGTQKGEPNPLFVCLQGFPLTSRLPRDINA